METSGDLAANLAARYRPRRFSELTGQKHVAAVLSGAVRSGRLPQQILLTGGSGLGKTTVARVVAAAELCETSMEARQSGDACGECTSCEMFRGVSSSHPDVVEMDAASYGGKDEIRELVGRAQTLPMRGSRKIYIIDEVHALTGSGVQAFLKLLEEPPAHVVFILATTNPEKLSTRAGGTGTIRSRCVELELIPPTDGEMAENLLRIARAEGWPLTADDAELIVSATDRTLGVRGTVNSLARIAPLLGTGGTDAVARMLGAVSREALDRLTGHIRSGDAHRALQTAAELRSTVGERAVRDALARWAHQDLLASLSGERQMSPLLALSRMERIRDAGPGPLEGDLLVTRLCIPSVAVDPDILAGQLHEAQRLIDRLEHLTRTAAPSAQPYHDAPSAAGDSRQNTEASGPGRQVPDTTEEHETPSERERSAAAAASVRRRSVQTGGAAEDSPADAEGDNEGYVEGYVEGDIEPEDEHGAYAGGAEAPASDKPDDKVAVRPEADSATMEAAAADAGRNVAGTFDDLSDLAPDISQVRQQLRARSKVAAAVWDACEKTVSSGTIKVTAAPALAARASAALEVWQEAAAAAGYKVTLGKAG